MLKDLTLRWYIERGQVTSRHLSVCPLGQDHVGSAVGSLVRNEELLDSREKIERENSAAEIYARPQPGHQCISSNTCL